MGIFALFFIVLPLILLFVVLGIGATLVRNILHWLGFGRTSYSNGQYSRSTTSQNQHTTSTQSSTTTSSNSRKVIGDDEGEYVEFEEVK